MIDFTNLPTRKKFMEVQTEINLASSLMMNYITFTMSIIIDNILMVGTNYENSKMVRRCDIL